MRLGIMQPYLFPYLGYWQLIKAVDKYVVYDDVSYIKGGWINRNNFLINGQKKLFTIRLGGASSHKNINEIEIKDDFSAFRKMLQMNYGRAPFFKECWQLVDEVLSYEDLNLGNFLFNSIKLTAAYLGIGTEILLSSEVGKDGGVRGKDRVLHLCKALGAAEYCNAIGGQELYDKAEFAGSGVTLWFVRPKILPYKQFRGEFVGGLSILDVLMFNSRDEAGRMAADFQLV